MKLTSLNSEVSVSSYLHIFISIVHGVSSCALGTCLFRNVWATTWGTLTGGTGTVVYTYLANPPKALKMYSSRGGESGDLHIINLTK